MSPLLTALLLLGGDDPIVKDDLLHLWRTRDEALRSVRIPFRALTKPIGRDSVTSTWDGVWSKDGSMVAVRWTRSDAGKGGTLVPALTSQAVWDGLRCEQYEKHLLTGKRRRERTRNYAGPFSIWMPLSFGVHAPNGEVSGWPGLLDQFQFKALGEEVISGKRCLKTLWYFVFDGKPLNPMLLWVDVTRTGLVWKHVTFNPAGERKAESALEVLGMKFLPDSEFLLEETVPVGDFWMPAKGRYRMLDNPALDEVAVTMDAAKIRINEARVAADFTIADEAGTVVDDNVRNLNLYLWGEKGTLTGEETLAEDLLRATASVDGLTPARHPGTPQPLLKASCGPGALYFWLRLHGVETSLTDILDRVHEDKGVSIQELADAATAVGRPMAVVRVNDRTAGCPEGNFIAHLSAPHEGHQHAHSEPQAHFVVARRSGREVRLISIPGAPATVSDYDFNRIWTGYALVPAEAAPQLAAPGRQRMTKMAYLAVGILALGVGLVLVVRRSLRDRRRNPGAAAAAMVLFGCVAMSTSGCSKSDAGGDQPLTVQGSSTFEFAPIPEGQTFEGLFRLRNDGAEPLTLSLVKSCGCTSATLSRNTMAPGEEQDLKFYINTEGRGGGFNQYIDVLGRGRKLKTLWIVGKVIPGLRLVVEPHLLPLGAMKIGDEVRHDLVVEAITSGEPVPVSLQLQEPPPDSPLAWEMTWEAADPKTESDISLNLRRFYKGTVRIKAVKPGRLDLPFLAISNMKQDPKMRPVALVSLEGTVYDGFTAEPPVLFLGDLGVSERRSRSIVVRPLAKLAGAPTVTCSSPALSPKGIAPVEGGYRIDLEAGPQEKPGLIRETVAVRWGDGSTLSVPVAGIRRQDR